MPTKLLFPRDSLEAAFNFSLLGMGDILIPGLLVGLLLRFDTKKKSDGKEDEQSYFNSSLAAYGMGLVASFLASYLTGEGQPALLYLVPLTVGSAVLVGLRKQELRDLWSFEIKKRKKTGEDTN